MRSYDKLEEEGGGGEGGVTLFMMMESMSSGNLLNGEVVLFGGSRCSAVNGVAQEQIGVYCHSEGEAFGSSVIA